MADSIPGQIWIGGKILQSLMREMIAVLAESGASFDNEPDVPRPETLWGPDTDLLDYLDPRTGWLSLTDGSARNGEFEDLEQWLRDHNISYDRHSDALYECNAENVYWRPGMDEPAVGLSTQDGIDLVERRPLQAILKLLEEGEAATATHRLRDHIRLPEPLPRLEFVVDPPPMVKKKRKR